MNNEDPRKETLKKVLEETEGIVPYDDQPVKILQTLFPNKKSNGINTYRSK